MKILFISHAMVVDLYRERVLFFEKSASNKILVVVPTKWKEAGQIIRASRNGVNLKKLNTIRFWGFHGATFLYGISLIKYIKSFKPDIIHVEEEYYSLALFQVVLLRNLFSPQSKVVFFTWQNIFKKYLSPFNLIESFVFKHVQAAIAGNNDAMNVLKKKGFSKHVALIPQVGVNPKLLQNEKTSNTRKGKLRIGYIGRVERSKGLDTLLFALKEVKNHFDLMIVGNGSYKKKLQQLSDKLRISANIKFVEAVRHSEIPIYLGKIDILVLPSQTTRSWKEQFGRILVEAMAVGIPVIGSTSGAIPEVIGDAGLTFQENSVKDLQMKLKNLYDNAELRRDLSERGIKRVLSNYTISSISEKTLHFYEQISEN